MTEKSCGFILYKKEENSIKYLLVKSLRGIFGFPKGHMELNETELMTALREVKEEVGLNPFILPEFKTSDSYSLENGNQKDVIYFLGEYNEEPTRQIDEISDIELKSYEEAIQLFKFDSHKRMLKEANDYLTNYYNESCMD